MLLVAQSDHQHLFMRSNAPSLREYVQLGLFEKNASEFFLFTRSQKENTLKVTIKVDTNDQLAVTGASGGF